MESEWDWHWNKKGKNNIERRIKNEIQRIWWSICTTRIKNQTK